ncbi:MAG: hypothetical protein IPL65_01910 [Lewinellaceae bacterium]|nr:hypothetical protein [Lewinellaceae bacterium]
MKQMFLVILCSATAWTVSAQRLDCALGDQPAAFLQGFWRGTFTQYSCGISASYPMELEIWKVEGNRFSGYFVWPDLPVSQYSKTNMTGEIKDGRIYLYEQSIVAGNAVVLNGIYESSLLTCKSMKGFWRVNQLQPGCPDPVSLENGGRYTLWKVDLP